jgi:glutathione S-transferase
VTVPKLKLFHFPGACSQVSVFALEKAGLPYSLELVNLSANEQSDSEYLEISPLGKVPTLLIDDKPLAENAAIISYIAASCPSAGLFPTPSSPMSQAEIIGGLAVCGGTLHPQVRGLANPSRLTAGDGEPVRRKATELAKKSFKYADQRIAERGWWLTEWSIIDVYLNWAFSVARRSGFDTSNYPLLSKLPDRLSTIPAFARMIDVETKARSALGIS